MPAAILLAFVAALIACHLALISDLLLVTIILALLIVLVATEPESGERDQAPGKIGSLRPTFSTDNSPEASGIFAASRRRSLGLSRRHAFPALTDTSSSSLTDAGNGAATAQLTVTGTF